MVLKEALVYTEKRFHQHLEVRCENGRIVEIGTDLPGEALHAPNAILLPGLIDMHTHGHGGYSYVDGEQSVRAIARLLPQTGVTAVVPALAGSLKLIRQGIEGVGAVCEAPQAGESRMLGVHLEGPFLSPDMLGAMNQEDCLPVSMAVFDDLCAGYEPLIRAMSIAPEGDDALEMIQTLSERGICLSSGHTRATYEQFNEAVERGLTHVTHLFNVMTPLHHREPNVPGAALLNDKVTVELICDGVHLHEGILKLVERCKQPENICLITDSTIAACLSDGEYEFNGRAITVIDGIARLKVKGNLAGSTLTMDKALRHMIEHTSLPVPRIIDMATAVPARQCNLSDRGAIQVGAYADFVLMNKFYQPQATLVEGNLVWQAEGNGYTLSA